MPRGMILKDVSFRANHIEELRKRNAELADGKLTHNDLLASLTRPNLDVVLDNFITADSTMIKLKEDVANIMRFSQNHNSVLITGPTGTGKELIARALLPNKAPFIARNCAGLPEELIYSLFFGHLKGTFTGADRDKHGILVEAKDGIVFLDEIADLSLKAQAMLLRALQERVICRLGAIEDIPIECRFVGATKFDLRALVELKLFREDLFARLFDFEVKTIGLENRQCDIPLIAEKGLDKGGRPMNYTNIIPDNALHDIYKYNVRGIQRFVQHIKTFGGYRG